LTELWKLFLGLVLATDMAKHIMILDEPKAPRGHWARDREGHKMIHLLIKVADVSNAARSFELADRWPEHLSICHGRDRGPPAARAGDAKVLTNQMVFVGEHHGRGV
jgi:hypothetical protein